MRTIFTLFASLLLSISLLAAPKGIGTRLKSMLTVKSVDRGAIHVVVDGRRFEPNDNYMRIQGIESGSHNIKIYRERSASLFILSYKKYDVVFNNFITIRPNTNVMISVDRFGKATLIENRMDGWGMGRAEKDWDRNHEFNYDRGINQGDFDKDRDGKFGDYETDYGYGQGMNDREFNSVLQQISKEWLETNKMKSATQIVTTNSLSSAQVKQMILLFNFESNKLELAKQAYQNTVDKKNYYMINDVFSFNGSKDELARYIRNFHP